MRAAHGGQIVVSGDLVQHAGRLPPGASTRPLGTYELRDIGRVTLYQLEHRELQHEFPALRTKRAVVHNLPVPLTSLVGRVREARAVSTLLDGHRLVTLLGEGGCGKTRLALQVAAAGIDRFVDGVWFVDLAPLLPGADATSRVADVLGLQGGLEGVVSALQDRKVLVVLDNCEHVLASTATLASTLLRGSAATRLLATSRAPLEVAGEARYQVPPLSVPRYGADLHEAEASEAVQLFTARAALVRPGFQLAAQDAKAIVELCDRLDGLPLAIELAAARLRGMSVAELASRVDDRFGLLVGGPRSAPQRHQALRNTMDWSVRLLDTDERCVLCHLATFRGGGDAEGVEEVCGAGCSLRGAVIDAVIGLVDKSLVSPVEVDGATRYRVHEAIREYALGSLSEADLQAMQERHARWFATVASRLRTGPTPGGERGWIHRHEIERDNFRAAAEWLLVHDPPAALRLLLEIEAGTDLTLQSGWWTDLAQRTLEPAAGAPAGDRACVLSHLAWEASGAGLPEAEQMITEAVELLREVKDPAVECEVLATLAKCNTDAAGGELDEAGLARAVEAGDRAGGTYWPVMVRYVLSFRTPPTTAESLNHDALRLAERLGLTYFAALIRANLATIAQFHDNSSLALEIWRSVVLEFDDPLSYAAHNAAFYALAEGEHGELAVGLHIAEDFSVRLTRSPHDPTLAAGLHAVSAHLNRLAGDLDGAEAALDKARRAAEPTWDFVGGLALVTRSALCRQRGQPRTAATVIEQAYRHVGFRGVTDIAMRVLEELAAVAHALGRPNDSANLLATARVARQGDNKPVSPACRPEVDALQATVNNLPGIALNTADVITLAHTLATSTSP
jgi:predicted ATPase